MQVELKLYNSESIFIDVIKYDLEFLDIINKQISARFLLKVQSLEKFKSEIKKIEENINKTLDVNNISNNYKNIILTDLYLEDIDKTYANIFLYLTMEEV